MAKKILEVVRVKNGLALGGDIAAMTNLIADRCGLGSKRQARTLLSAACEQIEWACDNGEELNRITIDDIVEKVQEILRNIDEEKRAPRRP